MPASYPIPNWLNSRESPAEAYLQAVGLGQRAQFEKQRLGLEYAQLNAHIQQQQQALAQQERIAMMETMARQEAAQQNAVKEQQRNAVTQAYHQEQIALQRQKLDQAGKVAAQNYQDEQGFATALQSGLPVDQALMMFPRLAGRAGAIDQMLSLQRQRERPDATPRLREEKLLDLRDSLIDAERWDDAVAIDQQIQRLGQGRQPSGPTVSVPGPKVGDVSSGSVHGTPQAAMDILGTNAPAWLQNYAASQGAKPETPPVDASQLGDWLKGNVAEVLPASDSGVPARPDLSMFNAPGSSSPPPNTRFEPAPARADREIGRTYLLPSGPHTWTEQGDQSGWLPYDPSQDQAGVSEEEALAAGE